MIHQKEDFITVDGKHFRCICADKEFAIFAPVTRHRFDPGYKTHLSKIFAVGQTMLTTLPDFARFYRGKFTSHFPNPKNILTEMTRGDIAAKKERKLKRA